MSDSFTEVGGNNISEIVKRLRANDPTLTEIRYNPLNAPQDKWNDAEYQAKTLSTLIDAMCVNTRLKSFVIKSGSHCDHALGRMLGKLIAKNRGLHTLEVQCTDLGADGGQHIANGLTANKTLREFKTVFCKLGDEGAAPIFSALETNSGLRYLSLSSDEIGTAGAKVFADALRKNKTLLGFSFAKNCIGDIGVEAILSALLVNKTVENADFSHISGNTSGIRKDETPETNQKAFSRLLEVVRANQAMTHLGLSYSIFTAHINPFDKLGEALSVNKGLAHLNMECCALFERQFHSFVKGLNGNTHLATIWGDDIGSAYAGAPPDRGILLADLAKSMRGNPNFVHFWRGYDDVTFKQFMDKNETPIYSVIAKILNPADTFNAEDAKFCVKAMHGIHEIAYHDELERQRKAQQYSRSIDHGAQKVAADVHAYNVLALADAKIKAIGLPGLKIPKSYKPYILDDVVPAAAKPAANAKKVDFSKLDDSQLGGSFRTVSKKDKFAALAHQAVAADQIEELFSYMEKAGHRLGAKELLYRPKEDTASIAEMMASKNMLGRILTAKHWHDDVDGLKELVESLGDAVVSRQMPEGTGIDDVIWEIESQKIAPTQGRKPIRIGVRPTKK